MHDLYFKHSVQLYDPKIKKNWDGQTTPHEVPGGPVQVSVPTDLICPEAIHHAGKLNDCLPICSHEY